MSGMKKAAAAALSLCLCLGSAAGVLAKDWGLGFQKDREGRTPVGNESADYLKEFGAYFADKDDEKVLYLTFDAGYEAGHTEGILDVLKEREIPAAFFLVGTYMRENAELVKRMAAEGHIVGNHTMKHPDMSAIHDKEGFAAELQKVEDVYRDTVGSEIPKFYRPPMGKYSEENLKFAHELGYKTIFWSLSYADFNKNKQPTREEAFSKLMPRLHPGAVILLHSTSKTSSAILDELITKYQELGYEFRSLESLGE